MKKLYTLGLTLAAVLMPFASATSAQAGPTICIPANSKAVFNVRFSAAWENGIKLINKNNGRIIRTFNNFYRRGAGGEWNQGAGTYQTSRFARRTCVNVIGMHKRSGANGSIPWRTSRSRVWRSNPPQIGFEDAGDNDFNDASVSVRFIRRPTAAMGFRGKMFCAPGGTRLTFHARFSALYENAIRIMDRRTGRILHSYNNYFRRGAGGEWNQGQGSWTYVARGGSQCFTIDGLHKSSKPNGNNPWKRSRFRSGGNRIGFEDAGDNDYNDASLRITATR